ncbi:MAG: AcrR family transcriptional regulator [Bacteroidia bacterium]|jgi:AcrR family transcriptional regulator
MKPESSRSAQSQQGRKPGKRGEQTRQWVLETAALCIAEEGYAAASTTVIAERAGVSWGVLQYHFGDKDSLMSALLAYSMEQTEQRFLAVCEGLGVKSVDDKLQDLVRDTWLVYATPMARAATEVVINNRSRWKGDPQYADYLLTLNHRLSKMTEQALFAITKNRKAARNLSSIFLAALHGFEARLLQHGGANVPEHELKTLARMMSAYLAQ